MVSSSDESKVGASVAVDFGADEDDRARDEPGERRYVRREMPRPRARSQLAVGRYHSRGNSEDFAFATDLILTISPRASESTLP